MTGLTKIIPEIMESIEVKPMPCGRCGRNPVVGRLFGPTVVCIGCGLRENGNSRQEAILNWNTMQDTRG